MRSLVEILHVFLKLGTIGFGGPAATIAMMEEEVVERRKWLTRDGFMDLVGMTNLIPGPNAFEIAIHVGLLRGGWLGFLIAGISFVLPATLISLGFAWFYVHFGSVADVQSFFFGIKPAVLAVIAASVWRMGKAATKNPPLLAVGLLVATVTVLGMNGIAAMFLGAVLGMFWLGTFRSKGPGAAGKGVALLAGPSCLADNTAKAAIVGATAAGGLTAAAATGVSLWQMGLFFLKVGAVLYGSGYVLVAFLEGGLVEDYHWLSRDQLLDAVAVGQFTPGPLLSTVTFIGYLLAGVRGAAVATVMVFLPSFFFVAALYRLLPRVRRSRWAAAFLDAVNVSAVALMAVVAAKLGYQALTDWAAWAILLAAFVLSLRWKVNPAWLVLGAAVAGWFIPHRA